MYGLRIVLASKRRALGLSKCLRSYGPPSLRLRMVVSSPVDDVYHDTRK
jgi:hypothetical protein